jgi:toxin-antitoxin system PIN domain toxin
VKDAVILPGVNVLVCAFRADCEHHAISKAWLDRTVLSDKAFAVSRLALSGVVRITTRFGHGTNPRSLNEAFGFCSDIVERPNCLIVEPGARHWAIFERLCRETDTRGPRVTDAWFAALAIEHGCEWITFDRDYARFPGLKWSVPG